MDDDFSPRLGRIRDRGAAGSKRLSKQVRAAARRLSSGRGKSGFTGRQNGRGAAAARQLDFASRRWQTFRARRVSVKTHIARAGRGGGIGTFRAHLHYIQRDGVERGGQGGDLYTREGETPEPKGFLDRSEHDRHQFRIIVSPEDGQALGDLRETTRALMDRMEHDLGTRLDWVAVDHHNTGHPHTHVIVRGKDQRGADLVIAPDYVKSGMRRRAAEIVTETLGPRRDIEIARSRHAEVHRDRFTDIDRSLLSDMSSGEVRISRDVTTPADRFDRSLRRQRLAYLEELGLAHKIESGRWQMSEGWNKQLSELGRRNDVIATLAAKFGRQDGHERLQKFDPARATKGKLLGTVMTGLPDDELKGTRSLVIEDFEGRRWLVDAGAMEPGTTPPESAIIEVGPRTAQVRSSDRTIAQIAEQTGGYYSADLHREADPSSTTAYRTAHLRRLDALRRAGLAERIGDDTWQIPADYLRKAAIFEQSRSGVHVQVRSWIALNDQIERHGLTWLDEHGGEIASGRIATARQARLKWLREQGLLRGGEVDLTSDARAELAKLEKSRAEARLTAQTGRQAVQLQAGNMFDGRFEGAVDLGNRRLALIGNAKAFALVPWRPEIERHRGREMIARRTANGVSWTIGAGRAKGLSR
mgnify:FL=1